MTGPVRRVVEGMKVLLAAMDRCVGISVLDDVHAGPLPAFSATHVGHQLSKEVGQALLDGINLFGIHVARAGRPELCLNTHLTY